MITEAFLHGQRQRQRILDHLQCQPHGATIRELCEVLGVSSTSTAWTHVQKLQKQGKVARMGPNKNRVFLATPKTEISFDDGVTIVKSGETFIAIGGGRFSIHVSQGDPEALRALGHCIPEALRILGEMRSVA